MIIYCVRNSHEFIDVQGRQQIRTAGRFVLNEKFREKNEKKKVVTFGRDIQKNVWLTEQRRRETNEFNLS